MVIVTAKTNESILGLSFTLEENGQPVDLTGYSAACQVREMPQSKEAVKWESPTDIDITGNTITLAGKPSGFPKPGRFIGDLMAINSAGVSALVQRIVFNIEGGYTR